MWQRFTCAPVRGTKERLIAEAMDHALAAADYGRAADLIERHYEETIWFGELALTRKWLEALAGEAGDRETESDAVSRAGELGLL